MKIIIGFIIGIIAVIFAVQNTEVVEVSFLAWSVSTPRAIMIIAVLVAGYFSGWLTKGIKTRQKEKQELDEEQK